MVTFTLFKSKNLFTQEQETTQKKKTKGLHGLAREKEREGGREWKYNK